MNATSSTSSSSTWKARESMNDPKHTDGLSAKTGTPLAQGPGPVLHDVVDAQTYWRALSTSSLAARRAGAIAASVPATTAITTNATSVLIGSWNVSPSPWRAWTVIPPRKRPTAAPSVAPIRAVTIDSWRTILRVWRRVMPTARSIPISRVRSTTDRASVLTIPNRDTITANASSTYRIASIEAIHDSWSSTNLLVVVTLAAGYGARACFRSVSDPPLMNAKRSPSAWKYLPNVGFETVTSAR